MTSPVPPTPPPAPAAPKPSAPVVPEPGTGGPPAFDAKAAWGTKPIVKIGTLAQHGAGKAVSASPSTWHYLKTADEKVSKQEFERIEGAPHEILLRAQERARNTQNALKKPLTTAQAILQGEDGAFYITSLSASKWGMTYGTPLDGPMLHDVFKGALSVKLDEVDANTGMPKILKGDPDTDVMAVAALRPEVAAVVGSDWWAPLGGAEPGTPVAARPLTPGDLEPPPPPPPPAPDPDPAPATPPPAGGPAPAPRAPGEVPRMADEPVVPPPVGSAAAAAVQAQTGTDGAPTPTVAQPPQPDAAPQASAPAPAS